MRDVSCPMTLLLIFCVLFIIAEVLRWPLQVQLLVLPNLPPYLQLLAPEMSLETQPDEMKRYEAWRVYSLLQVCSPTSIPCRLDCLGASSVACHFCSVQSCCTAERIALLMCVLAGYSLELESGFITTWRNSQTSYPVQIGLFWRATQKWWLLFKNHVCL